MRNLTIIGGSGFIGKSFIDAYQRGNLKLKINKLNILSRNPKIIYKEIHKPLRGIKLLKGDVAKIKKLPSSELIIYASEPAEVQRYSRKIVNKYIKAMQNFCRLVKKKKSIKILYISSGSVYGKNNLKKKYRYYNDVKKFSENEIKRLSKLGFKTSIARCFSFVGPHLPLNSNYAIGNFILDGLNKKKITVNANTKVYRSYLFSDDLVNWLLRINLNSNKNCPIYNVGSDKKIEIKDLAKIIGNIFSKDIKIKKKINDKKIDLYVPNINKIKKKLNVKITYNLKESIISTITRLNEKIN